MKRITRKYMGTVLLDLLYHTGTNPDFNEDRIEKALKAIGYSYKYDNDTIMGPPKLVDIRKTKNVR